MGIHVSVCRMKDGRYAGDVDPSLWDCGRMAGDREFAAEVLYDETKTEPRRELNEDFDFFYRPKDFAAWRAWDAAQPHNNGRWAGLADLLEREPDLWVYVSY